MSLSIQSIAEMLASDEGIQGIEYASHCHVDW